MKYNKSASHGAFKGYSENIRREFIEFVYDLSKTDTYPDFEEIGQVFADMATEDTGISHTMEDVDGALVLKSKNPMVRDVIILSKDKQSAFGGLIVELPTFKTQASDRLKKFLP